MNRGLDEILVIALSTVFFQTKTKKKRVFKRKRELRESFPMAVAVVAIFFHLHKPSFFIWKVFTEGCQRTVRHINPSARGIRFCSQRKLQKMINQNGH